MKRTVLVFFILLQAGIAFAQDGKDFFSNPPQARLGDGEPAAEPGIVPGRVQLSGAEIDALILPRGRAAMNFPSIDRFTGNEADPLLFRPVRLFAEGARVRVIADSGAFEQPIGARKYYIANNRSTGIGLAVDPQSGQVSGFAVKGGERLQIEGDFVSQLEFVPIEDPAAGSNTCGNAEHDLSLGAPAVEASRLPMSASASEAGDLISYEAVVAVDTDTEWMDGFGDNEAAAMNWITNLFLAMNVFYERDVETRLLIGDVTLRTGTDPYTVPSGGFAQLNEFGQYWMENMGHVERQFAALFSGRAISAYGFSGIAWVRQYCNYGHWQRNHTEVVGSYSYNAIGSAFPAGAAAHYVGHELGHNMGSPHTHCYSQPIDQCYSGESYGGNSCYSGPTACPADGSGTVMSYCHGLAGCHSDTEFHPTVQTELENRLAEELVAGCILPYEEAEEEVIFRSDFEV